MVNIRSATINKNTVFIGDRALACNANHLEQILCYYTNNTSQIQIIRSANLGKYYFERVVFPGQRLLFEAIPEAHIEIHTGTMATAILSDRIPCSHLRVYTD